MKLVAEIFYADMTDTYEPYYAHYTIPFEAESIEAGSIIVAQAIKNNTEEAQESYVFGLNFGPLAICDEHTLEFEVKTLEDWFIEHQKKIDADYRPVL